MLESRFFVPMGVLAEGVTFGVVHCGDIGHVLIIEFKSGQVEVLTLALRVPSGLHASVMMPCALS